MPAGSPPRPIAGLTWTGIKQSTNSQPLAAKSTTTNLQRRSGMLRTNSLVALTNRPPVRFIGSGPQTNNGAAANSVVR
jgi:hypothetical protein